MSLSTTGLRSALLKLIKTSQPSDEDIIGKWAEPYLLRHDQVFAETLADELYNVLPPWEANDIIMPLQRLGCYWAYAIITLSGSVRDVWLPSASEVEPALTRSMRFARNVEANLIKREAHGHTLLFRALEDRINVWLFVALSAKQLLSDTAKAPALQAILVEHLLVGGTYKRSLLQRLLARSISKASDRKVLSVLVQRIVTEAINSSPWIPQFGNDEIEKGLDMIVEEALPKAGALQIMSLLNRIRSKHVLRDMEKHQFNIGLRGNKHFVSASEHLHEILPS